MTCRVIDLFEHEFNALDVARQEYELAKEHYREIMKHRDCTNPDHQRRFRDALDRQRTARERYVECYAGKADRLVYGRGIFTGQGKDLIRGGWKER